MTAWAMKLKRSGYPETVRHQVITEAVRKFEKMCKEEDEGGRPVHRARSWQESARRLEKERKGTTWHKSNPERVSAPLIVEGNRSIVGRESRGSQFRFLIHLPSIVKH